MTPRWFSETLHPTLQQRIAVSRVLYRGRSRFQRLQVVETPVYGRTLILDGVVQTTERDEFIYHEMLTHLPLFTHPNPQRVLIIGGGDGGILREVLKHPVREAVLVEIDPAVIDVSRKYLQQIHQGSFDDRRARVIVDDGARYVQGACGAFDVIIVDSSDPIGPAQVLFKTQFYQRMAAVLTADGLMARQTGSTFLQAAELPEAYRRAAEVFEHVEAYVASVPTYIGGLFSFVVGSRRYRPSQVSLGAVGARYQRLALNTRYYNPEVHVASCALPSYIQARLTACPSTGSGRAPSEAKRPSRGACATNGHHSGAARQEEATSPERSRGTRPAASVRR